MEAPAGFRHISIKAPIRSLGKLKRGLQARITGGDMPLLIHDHNFDHITRTFSKGKGLNYKLSDAELHHNCGMGIFGKKADKFLKKHGAKKIVYDIGTVLKPAAKDLIKYGTDAGVAALSAYAPEFAPVIQKGGDYVNSKAQAYIDNPEEEQRKYRNFGNAMKKDATGTLIKGVNKSGVGKELLDAGSAYTGEDLNAMYAQAKAYHADPRMLQEHAIQQASEYSGHEIGAYMDMYNESRNATPRRQPLTDAFNSYTGQNIGKLDKASMGSYMSNLGLAQLEEMVQKKRAEMGERGLDFSGGDSRSMYADSVPDEVIGHGLYGHGLYGQGLLHRGAPRRRREMSSIGIGGNLIGDNPALTSKPMSANFQFGSRLGPAFQQRAHSGRGYGLYGHGLY